jgi:hypothetical protein
MVCVRQAKWHVRAEQVLQAGMLSAFKKKKPDEDDPKKPKSRSASVSVAGPEPPQKSLSELVHQVR